MQREEHIRIRDFGLGGGVVADFWKVINLNLTENEIETILDSLKIEILELQNYNKKYDTNNFLNEIEVLRQIRIKLNLKLEDF